MKLVSGLLGVAIIVAAMLWDTWSIQAFINLPSLIFTVAVPVCLLWVHYSPAQCSAALRVARGAELGSDSALTHMTVLSALRRMILAGGMIGAMVGLVQMLHHLDEPSEIGPAIAISLLSVLVALMFAEFCVSPLIHRIAARPDAVAGQAAPAAVQRGTERVLFLGLSMTLVPGVLTVYGGLGALCDLPSATLVLGSTVFFTLLNFTPADVSKAFSAAVGETLVQPDEAARYLPVLSTIRTIALAAGMVGTGIGLVKMLMLLDDPLTIGPAISVALLCSLYALVLSELLLSPLIDRARALAYPSSPPSARLPPSMGSWVIGFGIMVTLIFFLMIHSIGGRADCSEAPSDSAQPEVATEQPVEQPTEKPAGSRALEAVPPPIGGVGER